MISRTCKKYMNVFVCLGWAYPSFGHMDIRFRAEYKCLWWRTDLIVFHNQRTAMEHLGCPKQPWWKSSTSVFYIFLAYCDNFLIMFLDALGIATIGNFLTLKLIGGNKLEVLPVSEHYVFIAIWLSSLKLMVTYVKDIRVMKLFRKCLYTL